MCCGATIRARCLPDDHKNHSGSLLDRMDPARWDHEQCSGSGKFVVVQRPSRPPALGSPSRLSPHSVTTQWIGGGIAPHHRTPSCAGVHGDRSRPLLLDRGDSADRQCPGLAVRPATARSAGRGRSASESAPFWSPERSPAAPALVILPDALRAGGSTNTHTVTRCRETALYERMPPSRRPRCTLISNTMRFLIGLIALVTVRRERQIVSVDEPRHQPPRQFRTVQERDTGQEGRDPEQQQRAPYGGPSGQQGGNAA
jgi:hypothetical protein